VLGSWFDGGPVWEMLAVSLLLAQLEVHYGWCYLERDGSDRTRQPV